LGWVNSGPANWLGWSRPRQKKNRDVGPRLAQPLIGLSRAQPTHLMLYYIIFFALKKQKIPKKFQKS
jgi:hypothetical protein